MIVSYICNYIHFNPIMKCLKNKHWINSTEKVFKREVAFVDNTDDAIAEISIVDEDKDGPAITLLGDKKVCL